MQIHCLTTFMDGNDRFEAGDTRTVPDERGGQYVANGWAKSLSAGEPGDTSLAIHNATIGMGDSNG